MDKNPLKISDRSKLRISGKLRNGEGPENKSGKQKRTERERERDPISEGLPPLWVPWRPRTRGENLLPSRGGGKQEEEGGGGSLPLSPGGAGTPPGQPS